MFNFQTEVLDKSQETPVVVDFWASWCGPCRVLGPTIEQLASEANGEWELVKISTEVHPDLAKTYDIVSIPAVKMFHKGKIVAEFFGALARPQIQKWLNDYLPTEAKETYAAIKELLAKEPAKGIAQLKDFVPLNPQIEEAQMLLVQQLIFKEPEFASALFAEIPLKLAQIDKRDDIQILLQLMQASFDEEVAVAQKLKAAQIAVKNDDLEAAIKLLIEAVVLDKKYLQDFPRKACIAFFRTLWGHSHPLTKKHRISFDMALY
ncbi:MAG: tetratricopeptide repeat protein [Bacteroidota bacterium]